MSKHGMFVWNELASKNAAKARKFYAETLDWTFEEFKLPSGDYWVIKSDEEMVGGIGGLETASLPGMTTSHWFSFIEVDDVDKRIAKAKKAGAEILSPPEDVPGVGRVAVLRDPTGATVGWMTSLEEPE